MNIKRSGLGTLVLTILLVSILLVPAVSGKADELSSVNSENIGKKIIVKPPKLKEIEFTNTTTKVQIGDMLISFTSNSKYTEAKMELKNLTTNKISYFEYKVSQEAGKFKTDVYQGGKLINTATTQYNPIKTGETGKMLEKSSDQSVTVKGSTTYFYWDNVKFIKGSGIKYKHPDYVTYDGYAFEDFYISGKSHYHHHINDDDSVLICNYAPIVAGALIGYYCASAVGAVAGALLAAVMGTQISKALLDEQKCIWYWNSKTWAPALIGGMYAQFPMYYRISSYTLWNILGYSNP